MVRAEIKTDRSGLGLQHCIVKDLHEAQLQGLTGCFYRHIYQPELSPIKFHLLEENKP